MRDTWEPETALEFSAGKALQGRLPHREPVDIFAAIHESQQGTEDAGLNLVGHGKAAGGDFYQGVSARDHLPYELDLPIVVGFAESRLAAHFGALVLDVQCEVQNAHPLR
jgi:hypothetical protein